ncbi:MAG TPA: endonuclease I [Saprospirales bacterium]|nr:endonuclease I [Saprospirales bacterium]HAY71190.1 endonuclease I [Saprospirales bacterium]HRQ28648.1 endonuclease [Saprospiraceae bacterium]
MRYIYFFLLFWLFTPFVKGQFNLVINEIDSDTPGLDTREFLEIRSANPKFPLDGYVAVFFNCNPNASNASYLAIDLDGYSTDINGLFLIGSSSLEPFPQYVIPDNTIQNGQDAIAIYLADTSDFPSGTLPFVDERLVDVLVYGTNDPEATSALNIFRAFNPDLQQINEGGGNNTNSIQRRNDGTYFAGTPNPGSLNEGGGIELTRIRTTFDKTVYQEGETIQILFTADQPLEDDVNVSFILDHNGFGNDDYFGQTQVVFSKGSNQTGTTIQILEDLMEEGDEDFVIDISLDNELYLLVNNHIKIRVNDGDFRISPFGTPLNPTYGIVASAAEPDYYENLKGLAGSDLKQALQNIISDEELIRMHSYDELVTILKEADQNPENSGQVWLVYLEIPRSKLDFQTGSSNIGVWNREHVWPRDRGGFNSIANDTLVDGKDLFWHSNADSLRHANSDAHGLRVADGQENSTRGNRFYGDYTGPVGTAGKFRGDVARAIFYLAVRYNGLEVVEGFPEGETGKFGDLNTLLDWHRMDLADDFEMNRNNIIQSWQKNRNPFIDLPDLVEYIWGNKKGESWTGQVGTKEIPITRYHIFPNPSNSTIHIEGAGQNAIIELFNSSGQKMKSSGLNGKSQLELPSEKGMYWLKIIENNDIFSAVIMVQ